MAWLPAKAWPTTLVLGEVLGLLLGQTWAQLPETAGKPAPAPALVLAQL